MFDWPTVLALAIPAAQGLAELVAMLQTGTAKRKWQAEWTFLAVNVPYWLLIGLGIAEHLLRPTRPALVMVVAGSLLATAGITLRVICHYQLAGGFSPYVELAPQHRLVTTGLYHCIRHPMYAGSLLIFTGLPMILASPIAAALGVLAAAALLLRIVKEDRFLRQHLPGYEEYAQRTQCLVPGVW